MSGCEGISYEVRDGEGTPVVFIHGWMDRKETWRKVIENTGLENPSVVYDLRSHGESSSSKFDMSDLAEDLEKLVEELDLSEPFLVGHSLGGMVALKYLTAGNKVSGLFLIGTSASTPEMENYSPRFFLDKFGSMDRRAWAIELVKNLAGEECSKTIKDAARKRFMKAEDTQVIYSLGSIIGFDVAQQLKEKEVPAALVAGEKDKAVGLSEIEELSTLLDCNVHVLDSGHLMPQQKPEKLGELLTKFVNENDETS